jgi:hypothetical protein
LSARGHVNSGWFDTALVRGYVPAVTEPQAPRVLEPSAAGARPGATADWRATSLPVELEGARREVRAAVGAAADEVHHPHVRATIAWAAAELALQHCLNLAVDALYAALGATRPAPREVAADLAGRDPAASAHVVRLLNAGDTRTRYVFLEDLLAHLDRGA